MKGISTSVPDVPSVRDFFLVVKRGLTRVFGERGGVNPPMRSYRGLTPSHSPSLF